MKRFFNDGSVSLRGMAGAFVAAVCFATFPTANVLAKDEPLLSIGVARLDITPDYPMRLHGYGGRRTNSQGVAQHLFAKALVLGTDKEGARILFTVDNLAVSGAITDEVAARLKKRAGVARERIALCSSHTHAAPVLTAVAPNIFSSDIIPEQQAAIDRYTRELVDNLERVAITALSNRAPSKLSWTEGKVTFAKNRRVVRPDGRTQFGDDNIGPVDHTLATMFVRGADDKVRAVLANYACHCTTLGGEWNQIHGDWCGYAQEAIERDNPGAIALISIGCGGDANPFPRGKLENAQAHGNEIAAEVRRLLALPATPLTELPQGKLKRFQLDFDPLPTRAQWEKRATNSGIVGYHAKKNLARLDRGEKLPTKLPYIVQTWTFDDRLAMVFLAGEVVVDYELRLKREFDKSRLWVNGYANDVPCYIPSRRILSEGGYEAEDSLWYYDRPARLSPSNEDRIIQAVHDLLPRKFLAKPRLGSAAPLLAPPANSAPSAATDLAPQPLSPKEALASIRVAPEFTVDLVAAEPLVMDPVAIDWGADGKLWVAEMKDYPMGIDGKWKPGGRVKFLEDLNGDGHYDKATVLLDNLPFPTGVFAWRKGVLICAAPDIIYAEDTNGDGRADVVRKLFTGFETNNYQARVNSLSLGLDNWIYGANGLLGGNIRAVESERDPPSGSLSMNPEGRFSNRPDSAAGKPPLQFRGARAVNIRGRDFRMNPDTGTFEPVSGLTQQGRVRDDFGNWFGCDNGHLLFHYPLEDRYVRRNPHVPAPSPSIHIPQRPEWSRVFPASRTLERFNDPQAANRVTSACGLEIYRDEWLGHEFYGNAFTCEPVHNLVHREVLAPDGASFRSARAASESQSEFLASTDNWFRPVQVRTGPDGALWVVDMYRYVVEHPRWIPTNRLATLDVRAGQDKGRIYRVYRKDKPPRRLENFARLSTDKLAAALDSPNGTARDIVHRELWNRGDRAAVARLTRIATGSSVPAVRVQALSIADHFDAISPELLGKALVDSEAHVREHAVRLTEGCRNTEIISAASRLTNDSDFRVRWQLALSAGEFARVSPDAQRTAESVLAALLGEAATDKTMRTALLSSATNSPSRLLAAAIDLPESAGRTEVIQSLLTTGVAVDEAQVLKTALRLFAGNADSQFPAWKLSSAATLLQALSRSRAAAAMAGLAPIFSFARAVLENENKDNALRESALRLLASGIAFHGTDVERVTAFLQSGPLQNSAIQALAESGQSEAASRLLGSWRHYSPSQRAKVVQSLVSRREWTGDLLAAIERNEIAAAEISLAVRSRLLASPDNSLRERARNIWSAGNERAAGLQPAVPVAPGLPVANRQHVDRMRLIEKYRAQKFTTTDVANGGHVFDRVCSSCHDLNGRGHDVGPDLALWRDKSADDFLLAILDPNAVIEPRFVHYNIETKDGRSLSGIIQSESANGFTLVQGGGVQQMLLRGEIAEIRASSLSLMPEGLEQGITPTEMNDLIAYLKAPPPSR